MARERYLLDAGEETIHSGQITPETGREKAENWWFHYRNKLIVLVLSIAVVTSIVYSVTSKVEPDYTIAVVTSFTMPENGVEQLEQCFEQYADDRNGDGKIKVEVSHYTLSGKEASSEEQYQKEQADISRLSVDIALNDSMIFLHDTAGFSVISEDLSNGFFQYTDGTPMPDGNEDFENAMTAWKDVPALEKFSPQMADESDAFTGDELSVLFHRLRLSLRTDAGCEFDEETQSYYDDCMTLAAKLFEEN